MRRFRARRGFLGGLLVTVLIGLTVLGASTDAAARPNVVLIQTDDQRLDSLSRRAMPNVRRLLERPGTAFSSYYASTPLCCPSRAALITGQYGHNNGVLRNNYGDLLEKDNVLPVWLKRAGYRTAHVGKFMNHYPMRDGPAPGWDGWASVAVNRYYDYTLGAGSRLVSFGTAPNDYLGRVVTKRTVAQIRRLAGRHQPFYVQADYPAPHGAPVDANGGCDGAPVPDPRDEGRFSSATLPSPPSLNEQDMSDKPPFIAAQDLLTSQRLDTMRHDHRCMLRSLKSVDRGVRSILTTLRDRHELDETVIIFISDNGVFEGEHRIRNGKHFPYEEATNVPLLVRPTRAMRNDAPETVSSLAANIDIAPTILDLANGKSCAEPSRCRTMDGISLLPQLRGQPGPAARDVMIELDDPNPDPGSPVEMPCRYEAVHTSTDVYVEYSRAEVDDECEPVDEAELYELSADPFQLQNLLPPATSEVESRRDSLALRLDQLRVCAGVEGRDAQVEGRPFCAAAGT